MDRRRFLLTALAGVVAAPRAARAQGAARVYRIAWLASGSSPSTSPDYDYAVREAFRRLGYIEGENLQIESRFADGSLERLRPTWSNCSTARWMCSSRSGPRQRLP
jgi:putative ABC transport system substrate-binding protein